LNYSSSTKKDAQLKLSLVYVLMDGGFYQEAMDSIHSILVNHVDSKQAITAKYLEGHMYYAFGLLDSAQMSYQEYLSYTDTDSDLVAASLMGIAACSEEKSQYDRAIDYYFKVLKDYPNYFRVDEAFANMARCYDVKGDVSQAYTLYKEFMDKYPDSPLYNRVVLMLARIESRGKGAKVPIKPSSPSANEIIESPQSGEIGDIDENKGES